MVILNEVWLLVGGRAEATLRPARRGARTNPVAKWLGIEGEVFSDPSQVTARVYLAERR